MENAEEAPVRLGVLYYDPTLPRSWWELIDESTNIPYYWNGVMNFKQYARPSSLSLIQPPSSVSVPKKCPTCRHNIELSNAFSGQQIQTPSQLHQELQASSTFQSSTSYSNTSAPPHQQEDTGVVYDPIQNVTSRVGLGSAFHHMYSTTPVVPPSMIAANIFPAEHADVSASLTSIDPGKDSMFFSFHFHGGNIKWYCLDLAGGVKDNVFENKHITHLLNKSSLQHNASSLFAFNSLIYRIDRRPTRYESSATSEVQVLDIASWKELGNFSSWKKFSPLAKPRINPRTVSMGGKIYVFGAEHIAPCEINDIEVHTGSESSKFEALPFPSSPKIISWSDNFVVAFENQNKLVIGTNCGKFLYLYNVFTYLLETIDLNHLGVIPWGPKLPPVIVGDMLYFMVYSKVLAYDLVKKSHFYGTIDGLDNAFFRTNCNKYKAPRLMYLGGGKLCLICLRSRELEITSVVHCCIFDIPEIIEQGSQRLLRGRLHSVHKLDMDYSEELLDVLLI